MGPLKKAPALPESDEITTVEIADHPDTGAELMKVYYAMYMYKDGWWWATGDFSLEMFLGLLIMQEGGMREDACGIVARITAQNLYIGGYNGRYCHSQNCANAAINFFAWTSQAAKELIAKYSNNPKDIYKYTGPGSQSIYNHNDPDLLDDLVWARALGRKALTSIGTTPNGPVMYGNSDVIGNKLRYANISPLEYHGTASHTIYYWIPRNEDVETSEDAIYYTMDQKEYWDEK